MSFIRRHIVAVFFILTYLISWVIWLWVNGTGRGLSGWIGLVALLGAFGPSLAGLVCASLVDGWAGVRVILKRMVAWRVHWTVYLAVFLGPVLLVLAPIVLNTLLGGSVPHWQALLRMPELFPTALRMLLIGGLTEELGWRGFALPILRRHKGPLAASVIVGLVWGLWHWPIYSLPGLGNPLPAGELAWFILSTPILAIFFTALAERSRDSVWIAMLFHAWTNTVFYSLPELLGIPATAQLRSLNQFAWLLAAALIGWIWWRREHPSVLEAPGSATSNP
jgi:uncharacterized protein